MQTETTGAFGTGGDGRSPDEIERDIAGTRAAIESTVEELGEKLKPSQMAEDASSFVREKAARTAGEAWQSVVRTVSENPIPLALLGGGLAALLAVRAGSDASRRRSFGYGRRSGDFLDGPLASGLSAWLAGASGRAEEAGAHLVDRGAHAAARARELARPLLQADGGARVQQQAQQLRESLESLLREQPLLLGVAGFALGVVFGGRSSRSVRGDERAPRGYA
jgi:hypothetical protein